MAELKVEGDAELTPKTIVIRVYSWSTTYLS